MALGARNVAWHDALAWHTGEKSDKALDEAYACFNADGTLRADGGGRGIFWHIKRHAYDPGAAHGKSHLSVLAAVARDPDYAYLNYEVYDAPFWRLISPPGPTEVALEAVISAVPNRHGLFRVSGTESNRDVTVGNEYLKDKRPIRYAVGDSYEKPIRDIAAWGDFDGLTLLAALSREAYGQGEFEHLEFLRIQFEFCLCTVAYQYGLGNDLEILIQWLAHYRLFANRWEGIPDAQSRQQALACLNAQRVAQGLRPCKLSDFWVEALAIRSHNPGPTMRYPITPLTPELKRLIELRYRPAAPRD
ncbi:MAG: hypothetical protein ACRD22_00235 [Terriglobia bacterium]